MRILSVDIGRSKDPAAALWADVVDGVLWVSRMSTLRWSDPADLRSWIGRTREDTVTVVDGTGPHRPVALSMCSWPGMARPPVILQIRAEDARSGDPRVTCARKAELIDSLLDGLSRGLARIPRSLDLADELALQLEHYERHDGPKGPRYAAAPGYHDDLVMCLAMALWIRPKLRKLTNGQP